MRKSYVTKPGDTLDKIIEKHELSMDEFEKDNDINKLKLLEGQLVLVPVPYHASVHLKQYYVKENDTLNKISETFNVEVKRIRYFNPIGKLILQAHQVILIQEYVSPTNEFHISGI